MTDDPREAVRLLGLLADPVRLKVVAALALGAGTVGQVASFTRMGKRPAGKAMTRLVHGGLVRRDGWEYQLLPDVLSAAVAAAAPAPDYDAIYPTEHSVLRAYLRNGRIRAMPRPPAKRRLLLEHVVTVFEVGIRYPEREVDAMLRAFHDDHAMLRRHLVDADLLGRYQGVYWRTGGPVDV